MRVWALSGNAYQVPFDGGNTIIPFFKVSNIIHEGGLKADDLSSRR